MTVLHPEAASAAHHHAGDGSDNADSCGHSCDHSAQPTRSTLQDNLSEETPYKLHRRFDRLGRLFGDQAVATLMNARVAVIGLVVGGFVAESLARRLSGICCWWISTTFVSPTPTANGDARHHR